MKCPKCKKKMLLRKRDFSYNFKVKPKKKYERSIYWCKDDNIWISLEVPTPSKK